MFQTFYWRGKPILDIDQWARERGERMVKYRAINRTPWGPEIHEGVMPQTFWDSLIFGANWTYEEIE